MHVQQLTNRSNGYFSMTKFDQHKDVKPLSTIGIMFNSLCEMLEQDATPSKLQAVEEELENALGSQAGLLAGVVPNLTRLLPSCIGLETLSCCVDSAVSMRYLFGELLRVISTYSRRPISLVVDDVQWSNPASLLLLGNLLFSAQQSKSSIFFTFCHRDGEGSMSGPFSVWQSSISMFSLVVIELDNITPESVNKLMSNTLHLSPRLTRPLSSVLHHKTRGERCIVSLLF